MSLHVQHDSVTTNIPKMCFQKTMPATLSFTNWKSLLHSDEAASHWTVLFPGSPAASGALKQFKQR
jgi:hypothetical protein